MEVLTFSVVEIAIVVDVYPFPLSAAHELVIPTLHLEMGRCV